ncbi:SRA-YDG [Laetiporus sulphureus 93-53]|uniref:SRA-YDG n=1 Tax=Laetiporus sulphureus 93-53 TaxID=1314785 RepID=A0A165E1B9_9APHY|nr:SRA-YDG [Laetiporus sulphureus 93-53]KZT06059.1 SRA-YDG [Laetiporus sulphureus 93-53]
MNRLACSDSAVHPGIMAGIYGSKDKGAYSVVLSGGYDDDEDEGESFVYTGCGGSDNKVRFTRVLAGNQRSTRMGPQLFDQTFGNSRNKSLLISSKTGKPVRVVRGYNLDSDWAPASGYRYDGLYRVVDAWRQKGKSGHLVCKYEFKVCLSHGFPQV